MSSDTPAPGRKPGLRPQRRRAAVETEPYGDFVRRAIRAYGRRIGEGNVEELEGLLELHELIDAVAANAVRDLRVEQRTPWQAIADVVGITRQAAMMRWPRARAGGRQPGGQPANLR
jgi:hypothetical protein